MNLDLDLFVRLITAIALGALIGAEREMKKVKEGKDMSFAGLRTYTLVSMMGFIGAHLAERFGMMILAVLLAAVVLFFFGSYLNESRKFHLSGITSEISAVIAFLVGVIAFHMPLFAAALSIVTVLILATKEPLHHFVWTLAPTEFLSAIKFIIIAFIILPVLPRTPIDPWGLIVLYNAWLMVVFVSAMSFIGYFLVKFIGQEKGIGLTALVGGLASSTATTMSLSQQGRLNFLNKKITSPLVFGVTVASCVMFIKALLEVAVINWALLSHLITTLGVMIVASLVALAWLWWEMRHVKHPSKAEEIKVSSPFHLWPALQFGLLYIFILVIAEVGNRYLGDHGVYMASAIAGLADVDAITLSLSNLSAEGSLPIETAAHGITIAVMMNTLVKLGIVRIFGTSLLFNRCLLTLGFVIVSGLLSLIFI